MKIAVRNNDKRYSSLDEMIFTLKLERLYLYYGSDQVV